MAGVRAARKIRIAIGSRVSNFDCVIQLETHRALIAPRNRWSWSRSQVVLGNVLGLNKKLRSNDQYDITKKMMTVKRTMPKYLSIFVSLFILLAFSACKREPVPHTYFPETGRYALHQRALDLANDFKVLSLALEPGYEDLETLAYLRLAKGATITSAYLTNGEAGESDVRGELPHELAGVRREEAYAALAHLNGQTYYLNLPHLPAARDSNAVRAQWPADTVRARLAKLMLSCKPDLILLAPDWQIALQAPGWRWQCFVDDVLAATENIALVSPTNDSVIHADYWRVARVLVDDGQSVGTKLPLEESHPLWKKSYRTMGTEAASRYASLQAQRWLWRQRREPSYLVLAAAWKPQDLNLLAGLPLPGTARLLGLQKCVEQLAQVATHRPAAEALWLSMAALDSAVLLLTPHFQPPLNPFEKRRALHWKRTIDDLRCSLMGVEVSFTFSDTALAERQLTYLTIQSVKGASPEGNLIVYFPHTNQGWVVNENLENKLPVRLNEPYRLLSPQGLTYTHPPARYLSAEKLGQPFLCFVIHESKKREDHFIYRIEQRMEFAPRIVEEVVTPIVRWTPGERLVVRLMNISRDGVSDTLMVRSELAVSTPKRIRLSQKGATKVDTLALFWQKEVEDGTYLIPIQIGGITIANFAARKFEARIAPERKIGLISSLQNSPTAEALRRLRVDYAILPATVQRLDEIDILIIDRRALSLQPELAQRRQDFEAFVAAGGHLLVLAQDAPAWNASPLWPDMQLTASQKFDANYPLASVAGHPLLSQPNVVSEEDWQDWLYARAYNRLAGAMLAQAEKPVSADGEALVVTRTLGQGRQTYVDLAFGPQLANVHPGAFRLLANLISF